VSPADLAAYVEASRKASGLEAKVREPVVLAKVARMVAGRREAQPPVRRVSA
jgi:hypothetical protein